MARFKLMDMTERKKCSKAGKLMRPGLLNMLTLALNNSYKSTRKRKINYDDICFLMNKIIQTYVNFTISYLLIFVPKISLKTNY